MMVLARAARGRRQHHHLLRVTCLQGARKGRLQSPVLKRDLLTKWL
jgi:hypothetical protein